jgi:DegV family protein with EDD domain
MKSNPPEKRRINMLRIVTDGAADMPETWKTEYDIHVLPLRVRFGEDTFVAGVDMSEADFYRLVRERNQIPKTSLPSPGDIQTFYERCANPGDTILSLHVSRKLSGTMATVEMAAREVMDRFHVIPFDSASGSMAMGFMCRAARILERSGAGLEQILARLEEMRASQSVIFTLDTLEFALMNGRVTAIQNLITQALQVKPILILREGELDMADKVRTRQRSLERVLERVRDQIGSRRVMMAVVHALDLKAAQYMHARAHEIFQLKELLISTLSIPVTANLGPRGIGIVAMPVLEE